MEKTQRRKRTTLSKNERGELLAAFRESGMTQKAFAQSWGLNVATFRSWLYAEREGARPSERGDGFIEVAVSPLAPATATIRFPGGPEIDFPVAELERAALALARELERR